MGEDESRGMGERKSSLKVFVLDPYFRIAVWLQPLFEATLDAYSFLQHQVLQRFATLSFLWQVGMVFFGILVTFFGSHVSKTVSFFAAAFRNDRLWDNFAEVNLQISTSKQRLDLTSKENTRGRVLVILGEVDPGNVSELVADVWRSVLFAGATAKLVHAKTISLGLVLGEHLNRPMQRYLVPVLERETRPELAKWYAMLFFHVCAVAGVLVAFQLEPFGVLGLLSTSVKGAHMIVTNTARLLSHKYLLSDGLQDFLVVAMVGLGLGWQTYFSNTPPPAYLKFVWFPAFALEHYMIGLVTWM